MEEAGDGWERVFTAEHLTGWPVWWGKETTVPSAAAVRRSGEIDAETLRHRGAPFQRGVAEDAEKTRRTHRRGARRSSEGLGFIGFEGAENAEKNVVGRSRNVFLFEQIAFFVS